MPAQLRTEDGHPCPGQTITSSVDLGAFTRLHQEGRDLIQGWFERATRAPEKRRGESFNSFIYVWFAYNGWAACCSGLDDDRRQREAMASSLELQTDFAELMSESDVFARQALTFHQLWPIFRAQALRRAEIPRAGSTRPEIVAGYLAARPKIPYRPACYETHRQRGESVPLDWPHMLLATYQVRCNLFHGEKAAHSEMDGLIVDSALRAFVPVIGRYVLPGPRSAS